MGYRNYHLAVLLYCIWGLSGQAFAQCPTFSAENCPTGGCDQGEAYALCELARPSYEAHYSCVQNTPRTFKCRDDASVTRIILGNTNNTGALISWTYGLKCSDRPEFDPETRDTLPEYVCNNGCEYTTAIHISVSSGQATSTIFKAKPTGDLCTEGQDDEEASPTEPENPCVETPNGLVCGDDDKVCAESETGIVCVDYDDTPKCEGPLCVSEPDTQDPPTNEPPEPTNPPDTDDTDDTDGTSTTSAGPPPICEAGATCNFNWTHNGGDGGGDGGGGDDGGGDGGGGDDGGGDDGGGDCTGPDCECTGPDCDDGGDDGGGDDGGGNSGGSGCVGPDCDPGTGECTGPNCTPCSGASCGGDCQGPNCGGDGGGDDGGGDDGGGDCTGPDCECTGPDCDDGGDASGGGTCAAPPSCSGDAIGCMVAYQGWRSACETQRLRLAMDGEAAEPLDGNAEDHYSETMIDSSLLDTSGFLGGGACPNIEFDLSFFGVTHSVPPLWCDLLGWIGWLVVASATVTAVRIIGGA